MAEPLSTRRSPFLAERPFLRYFVPLVTIVGLLGAATLSVVVSTTTDRILTETWEDQRAFLDGVGGNFTQPIVGAAGDLAILVQQEAFLDLAPDPTQEQLDRVTAIFESLSGIRGVYDQVRLLDLEGMERVRVDLRDGAPVRSTDLQSKSSRYYFTSSVDIPRGSIYISPIDLNVEQGRVEIPRKPMIRLASPVFDADGARRGVVILNYLGDNALEAIRADAGPVIDGFHLANEDGHWLLAPDEALEWGFMFDAPDLTVGARDPEAWDAMTASDRTQVRTDLGLYTTRTLSPHDEIEAALGDTVTEEGRTLRWVAYSFLSDEELARAVTDLRSGLFQTAAAVGLLLLVLIVVAAWALGRQWADRFRLRQSQFVFEAAADGIVVADDRRRVVTVNPAFSEITGVPPTAAVGSAFPALHTHLDPASPMWEDLRTTGRFRGEFNDRWPDGRMRTHLLSASTIVDERGKPERYVGVVSDITAQAERERGFEHRATHDDLTGLANRQLAHAVLERELARGSRAGHSVTVLFMDLDGFKQVNDTLGHQAGDELLIEISSRLATVLRDADTVARVGGDEFVAVLADVGSRDEVAAVVDRVLAAIREPVTTEAGPARVRGSVGVAVTSDTSAPVTGDELLDAADEAMYEAKAAGGDCLRWGTIA